MQPRTPHRSRPLITQDTRARQQWRDPDFPGLLNTTLPGFTKYLRLPSCFVSESERSLSPALKVSLGRVNVAASSQKHRSSSPKLRREQQTRPTIRSLPTQSRPAHPRMAESPPGFPNQSVRHLSSLIPGRPGSTSNGVPPKGCHQRLDAECLEKDSLAPIALLCIQQN